jgi:hypothetical protein
MEFWTPQIRQVASFRGGEVVMGSRKTKQDQEVEFTIEVEAPRLQLLEVTPSKKPSSPMDFSAMDAGSPDVIVVQLESGLPKSKLH